MFGCLIKHYYYYLEVVDWLSIGASPDSLIHPIGVVVMNWGCENIQFKLRPNYSVKSCLLTSRDRIRQFQMSQTAAARLQHVTDATSAA